MAEWKELSCRRAGETCQYLHHRSGLSVYVWHKENYATTYASLATKYGSVDTAFLADGETEPTVLPAGIAHYLEHKLFENEDCDAFERYAEIGANGNAYTTFDHTAYLFSCTKDAKAALEILLDFVQSPYFTEQTVEKERGIIGQEIRMGKDSPTRRVFQNLLEELYVSHPVRVDIAGTEQSIAEITPELLYRCYEQFYDLSNMVLAVSGALTAEEVEKIVDRLAKPSRKAPPMRAPLCEPAKPLKKRVEVTMPVAVPLFFLGYKTAFDTKRGLFYEDAKQSATVAVLERLLGGHANPLYADLLGRGLINAAFDVEYFDGPGYGMWMIGGESVDPDAVCEAFRNEIERLRRDGIDKEAFEAARNAVYGGLIGSLDDPESCGDLLIEEHLCGRNPFSVLDEVAALDIQSVYERLCRDFDEKVSALSLVLPAKG